MFFQRQDIVTCLHLYLAHQDWKNYFENFRIRSVMFCSLIPINSIGKKHKMSLFPLLLIWTDLHVGQNRVGFVHTFITVKIYDFSSYLLFIFRHYLYSMRCTTFRRVPQHCWLCDSLCFHPTRLISLVVVKKTSLAPQFDLWLGYYGIKYFWCSATY